MIAGTEGFLVVLSDVKAEHDREYLAWLTTEHIYERLGIPGFLAVRIFRKAIAGGYQYFIWYTLESADVVDSAAYLDRLNNPTPWSQTIMPLLRNFRRGGGSVIATSGETAGDRIAVVAFEASPSNYVSIFANLNGVSEIAAARLLATDKAKSAVRTTERELRRSDNSFDGLFIVESKQDEPLAQLAKQMPQLFKTSGVAGGQYREILSLVASIANNGRTATMAD